MTYAARRLLYALLVVFLVVTFSFFLVRLTGDPVALIAGAEATEAQIRLIQQALNLDKPLWLQYAIYMGEVLRGDFGRSFFTTLPAMSMILQTLPNSLLLTLVAFAFAVVVALPVGVLSAARPDSPTDWTARFVSVLGQCTPVFWLGILMMLLFSVKLRWLPFGGAGTWQHLVMPGLTLSAVMVPVVVQVTRSALLEALRQDYVRTARSKGLTELQVLLKHALRNASIPVVTVLGLRLGFIVGGAIVTETVFSYPGLGRLAVQAVNHRDFPIIQALLVIVSTAVVAINLMLDWLYTLLDPRVRA
ncbi:MAG: ABC transporter permease [Candidatus Rokubacteria bacterium]|nr:ABC transporter permease [Candidatus Rokubacteria bacterium]